MPRAQPGVSNFGDCAGSSDCPLGSRSVFRTPTSATLFSANEILPVRLIFPTVGDFPGCRITFYPAVPTREHTPRSDSPSLTLHISPICPIMSRTSSQNWTLGSPASDSLLFYRRHLFCRKIFLCVCGRGGGCPPTPPQSCSLSSEWVFFKHIFSFQMRF